MTDEKAANRRSVLRLVALEAVWDWVSRSHATFPLEHDHHCGGHTPCTCGWDGAKEAMSLLDTLDRGEL